MMKREQGLARTWRGTLEETEPHFDDERTILSAQPVVPLETVETVENVKSRRTWVFIAAFVVASLLGSAAALALIKIRQPTSAEVATETSEPEESEPAATEQPVAQVANETSEPTEPEPTSSVELAKTESDEAEPPKRVRQTARRTASTAPLRVTIKANPRDVDEDEPRLIDQWQERRQRRVNRTRNPQDEHHSSDLFRIREIFEGPRRSRRTKN